MFSIYNICSYFCNLATHFSALGGCSTKHFLIPQNFSASTSSAEAQCCSIDGQFCYRHHPESAECWSGNNDAAKVTWHEAYEMCTSAGYRLCKSQEELDLCCGTGCSYNKQLVWTSLEAGTKLQALH